MAEIEKLALEMPENHRALLAVHLLHSLPPVLSDEDEGLAEASRRDADFESDGNFGISLEEIDRKIALRRGA